MYLLDSDYLIHFLNGDNKTVQTIQILQSSGFPTSIINIAELLEGFLVVKENKKIALFDQLLTTLTVYPVDFNVAHQFAKIRQILRKKGRLIDNLDILIAATCLAHDQILLTYNHKHFDRIPNLRIYQKNN